MNFIKKIFSSKKMLSLEDINKKEDVNMDLTDNFFETLKKDTKHYFDKNNILDDINKNPNLIYSLSYTRLVQLNKLYEERISQLEMQLK